MLLIFTYKFAKSVSSTLSLTSLTCTEMSLPALPTSETKKNHGGCHCYREFFFVNYCVYDKLKEGETGCCKIKEKKEFRVL